MDVVPILSLMIFLPALGALLIFCIPKDPEENSNNIKKAVLFISLATFFMAVMVWGFFEPGVLGYQFIEKRDWLPDLGFSYGVGVDGLSLPFVLIVASCVPLLCVTVRETERSHNTSLYLLFLLLETSLIGALCSLDLMLFYVFSESSLILSIFILAGSITPLQKKLFLAVIFWSLITSMIFLVALLWFANELNSLFLPELFTHTLSRKSQVILWTCFFGYFFFKIFLCPLCICFSSGAYENVTGGDILGGMGFMMLGFYGMVRFVLPLFPEVTADYAPWIQGAALIGIVASSISILSRGSLSRIVPFISLIQMTVALLAVFLGTAEALIGAVFMVINQLIIWVAVLLGLGVKNRGWDSLESGRVKSAPRGGSLLTFFFMVFLLSGLGFPGTSGFMGLFLVMMGACAVSPIMAAVLAFSIIFMSVAFLWALKGSLLSQGDDSRLVSMPLRFEGIFPLSILGVAVVALGIFPSIITVLIQAPMDRIIIAMDRGEPEFQSVLPRMGNHSLSPSLAEVP